MKGQIRKPHQAKPAAGTKPGGLLASEYINRSQSVLPEDFYTEPTRDSGVYSLDGDYIRFFDAADSQLRAINAVYNASPTTRSIIRQKTTLVIGDGFTLMRGRPSSVFLSSVKGEAVQPGDPAFALFEDALSEVNAEGQSLLDVCELVASEYLTYGNAFFCMSRTGDKVFAHHLPVVKCRVSERRDGKPSHVGVNNRWKDRQWSGEHVQKIPIYPMWMPDENGVEWTVIHLKDYAPGFDYYGLPEWVSALLYAEIEYRIAKFNSSKFENGYMPSGVLQFFGAVSEEEAKEVVKDAKNKFVGTGKNSGLLIQVLSDESLKAHFTQFEQRQEGEFLELSGISAQAIVSAHRWTMSLAGFATKGQLGTNEQIRLEFEIAQNTVIRPLQNMLLRRIVGPFIQALTEGAPALNGHYLQIQNTTPVSFVGDIDIDAVLTSDEKREIAGYAPLNTTQNADPANTDTAA